MSWQVPNSFFQESIILSEEYSVHYPLGVMNRGYLIEFEDNWTSKNRGEMRKYWREEVHKNGE